MKISKCLKLHFRNGQQTQSIQIFQNVWGTPFPNLQQSKGSDLKMNNIGVGAQGHVRKSRNHKNEGIEGSHKQIEKL